MVRLHLPDRPLPAFAMTGGGTRSKRIWHSRRVHVSGQLEGTGSHWGVLSPAADRVAARRPSRPALNWTQCGPGRCGLTRLEMQLAGRSQADCRGAIALQPFEFEPDTGNLKTTDPQADWLDIAFSGFPLEWLPIRKGRDRVVGQGDATGQVRNAGRQWRKGRLSSAGCARRNECLPSRKPPENAAREIVDLTRQSCRASYRADGWEVKWTPFTVNHDGRRLATSEGSVSHTADADQLVAVKGNVGCRLGRTRPSRNRPGRRSRRGAEGDQASGDFSASIGGTVVFDGTGALTGRDPAHTVSGSLHAEGVADGPVSFVVPLKIGTGKKITGITAEGEWQGSDTGIRLNAKITSDDADWKHLRLLAAPLANAAGFPLAAGLPGGTKGSTESSGGTDREPFWGNLTGLVNLDFGVQVARGTESNFPQRRRDHSEIEPGSIHLARGQAQLGETSARAQSGPGGGITDVRCVGGVSLPPRGHGFRLSRSGSGAVGSSCGPEAKTGPVLEGHFAIAGHREVFGRRAHAARSGRADSRGLPSDERQRDHPSAPDLRGGRLSRRRAGFDLVRCARHGGVAGEPFAGKRKEDGDRTPAGKKAQPDGQRRCSTSPASSRPSWRTIGLTSPAMRRRFQDGTRSVSTAIEMVAADERLTGSRSNRLVSDRPLRRTRPLSVDLKLGVRGDIAGGGGEGRLAGHARRTNSATLRWRSRFISAAAWRNWIPAPGMTCSRKAATRPVAPRTRKHRGKKAGNTEMTHPAHGGQVTAVFEGRTRRPQLRRAATIYPSVRTPRASG